MADSIRQQIIDAVDIRLKGILISNGYETDIGTNVFWWKETPYESADLPAINCRDRTEELDNDITTFGADGYNLPIEIKLSFEGSTSIDEAREAINDVIAAIREDDAWAGLAVYTDIGVSEMASEQAEEIETTVSMVATVHYQVPEYLELPAVSYIFSLDSETAVAMDSENRVSLWGDVSGRGLVVTQSNDSQKPILVENQVNGHPSVRFDGINDFLQSVDFSWFQPCVVYVVCKIIAFTSNFDQLISGGTVFPYAPWLAMWNSGITVTMAGPYLGPSITVSAGTWMIIRAIYSGGTSSLRKNNDSPSTGDPGSNAFNGFTIARQGDWDGNYSNIDVARIQAYNYVPEASEDAAIMLALNTKYAIY